MNILVTGGAGFIGSNLVLELVNHGHYVKVIDNLITGNKLNLKDVMDKITFVDGSVTDLTLLQEEFKGADIVFHEAALPAVPRSIKDPISTNDSNVVGTLNVLIAAKENNVKRVIYAGSSSVYGDTPTLPKKEDMMPYPKSPYAVSKLAGEYYCKVFSEVYGLDIVTLRYFNVFGPRQNPDSHYAAVIPLFIKNILNSTSPTVFGDGTQTRDFTFVRNVVHANLLAMEHKGKLNGDVINIATGKRITVAELVAKINLFTGKDIKPVFIDERKGDIKHSLADISKAKRVLGYIPVYTFEEGLKETVSWFR